MRRFTRQLNLQAKISLVLVSVIIPTFLIVTIAENKLTKPILEQEILQMGISAGKRLAAEVDSSRLLLLPNPTPAVENALQEILLAQPDILRIDVIGKEAHTGKSKLVATNFEDDPLLPSPALPLVENVTTEFKTDKNGLGFWEIYVPIEHKGRDPRGPKRLKGTVHLLVSTNLVDQIVGTLWRTTVVAALFSVVSLILALSYFLRKTVEDDRRLRQAQSHNLRLTEQLHETQRQLMIKEKLAVMGQLTASFAHEIGTPLNAIGGHLQLLKEELPDSEQIRIESRFNIVNGQLSKIEKIVKGFLQSTSKPTSQKQLVDLNVLCDKAMIIISPMINSMDIEVKKKYDLDIGPMRAVPLEIEQILLNVLNNSLDSIRAKLQREKKGQFKLGITTSVVIHDEQRWAQVSLYDTGEGIRKVDLKNVLKPFYTTKRPGEGTGLGLTICQQLITKHGGALLIDSKEGNWTEVILRLPYPVKI